MRNRSPSVDEVVGALEVVAETGVPAPRAAWITDVGTSDYLDFFEREIIDELISGGGSTCRFYEATYGGGKSHLLDLLGSRALIRGLAVVQADLSHDTRLDEPKVLVEHILESLTIQINGEYHVSLPAILEALSFRGTADPQALDSVRLPHPGFARAMRLAMSRSLESTKARDYLRRYLVGERIGAVALRGAGIQRVNEPLSKRNAEQVLFTVADALHAVGVPGFLLLFDESERALEVHGMRPALRVVQAANLIRRLIDACTTGELRGVVAVFAVLPGFLQRCSVAYAALGQRIQPTEASRRHSPWRWPTLDLQAINSTRDADAFADGAIRRMCELIENAGIPSAGARDQMRHAAGRVLEQQAGGGYRGDLMKALAAIALAEVSS